MVLVHLSYNNSSDICIKEHLWQGNKKPTNDYQKKKKPLSCFGIENLSFPALSVT